MRDRRAYSHEYYRTHRDAVVGRVLRYGRTERGRSVNRAATQRYKRQHPELAQKVYGRIREDPVRYSQFLLKHRAYNKVYYALRTGKLRRGVCAVCGSTDVHAHHDDYGRPLDVVWLCPLHHGVTRRKEAA